MTNFHPSKINPKETDEHHRKSSSPQPPKSTSILDHKRQSSSWSEHLLAKKEEGMSFVLHQATLLLLNGLPQASTSSPSTVQFPQATLSSHVHNAFTPWHQGPPPQREPKVKVICHQQRELPLSAKAEGIRSGYSRRCGTRSDCSPGSVSRRWRWRTHWAARAGHWGRWWRWVCGGGRRPRTPAWHGAADLPAAIPRTQNRAPN